jgi:glyoxylase-like metal-dependent hydrolase (beta-lactamase superfamily II)
MRKVAVFSPPHAKPMTMKIHSFRVGVSFSYLVEGDEGTVLVDTGSPGHEQEILRWFHRVGAKGLRLILITHAHLDHYGSAAALRRRTGALIGIHRADAEAMARGETPLGDVRGWGKAVKRLMPLVDRHIRPEPTRADVLFDDGDGLETYGVDATVLHTPGHTPGSTTLLVNGRLAIVGDLASTRGWSHAQLFYAADWSVLARSLERLQKLDLEWVYTGHGPCPMSGKDFKKLRARRG